MRIMHLVIISLMMFPTLLLADPLPLDKLHLPPGFHIEIYAKVPEARQMALGKNQIVFVGTRGDKVFAVLPQIQAGQRPIVTVADKLYMPNGVAILNDDLYVAEVNRI